MRQKSTNSPRLTMRCRRNTARAGGPHAALRPGLPHAQRWTHCRAPGRSAPMGLWLDDGRKTEDEGPKTARTRRPPSAVLRLSAAVHRPTSVVRRACPGLRSSVCRLPSRRPPACPNFSPSKSQIASNLLTRHFLPCYRVIVHGIDHGNDNGTE